MDRIYLHGPKASRSLRRPGLIPLAFFLVVIGATTLALLMPGMTRPGQSLSVLDACFTATSATCVTGLIVVDTPTTFTPLGQSVIALAIQLGGLGYIIFGSFLALVMSHRLSIKKTASFSQALNDVPLNQVRSMLIFVVAVTLCTELAGAIVLTLIWPQGDPSWAWHEQFGLALFTSISAFCNAGFALQTNSFSDPAFRYHPATLMVLPLLITLGGIGFPVIENLLRVARYRYTRWQSRATGIATRKSFSRANTTLSLHTKLVLVTTLVIYFIGTLGVFLAQQLTAPEGVHATWGHTLADAHFLSVTSRTAGFNSMPSDELSLGSRFLAMVLMFVGGSPGGTAGGIKTVTIAVLMVALWATLRNRSAAITNKRTLPDPLIKRAAALLACYLLLLGVGVFLLTLTEPTPHTLTDLAFEVVSAATTTGLSLGMTDHLTSMGKIIIMALMLIGRLGPLVLFGVLFFASSGDHRYRYPSEQVILG